SDLAGAVGSPFRQGGAACRPGTPVLRRGGTETERKPIRDRPCVHSEPDQQTAGSRSWHARSRADRRGDGNVEQTWSTGRDRRRGGDGAGRLRAARRGRLRRGAGGGRSGGRRDLRRTRTGG